MLKRMMKKRMEEEKSEEVIAVQSQQAELRTAKDSL